MNPSAIPGAPQPNAFERALPTIGGTLGGFIGGFGGGAAGVGAGAAIPGADLTGVPEVAGGVAGAKLGSAAGAGIGGAAGKTAEDILMSLFHQQGAPKTAASAIPGIAGEGAVNAIGQGAGDLLVGGGRAVLSGVTGLLEKGAAGRATDQAAKAATDKAASEASDAEARANAFKNNYGSITDRLQRDLNLGTNSKFVDSMGFDSADPAQMGHVSNGGLELNTVYDKALRNAPNVDISGEVLGPINKAVAAKQPLDVASLPQRQALEDAGISMDANTLKDLPATQARQFQQKLGLQIGNSQKIINNAETQGTHNLDEEAKLKNLQQLYQQIGAKIKTPEVNQSIAGTTVSDDGRAALVTRYGDKLGNHLADTVNNAKSADDLLGPMQSFTQMNTASDMATNDIENAVGTSRAVARTKAANPAPEKPSSNTGTNVMDALAIGGAPFTHGVSLLGLIPHVLKTASSPAVQDAALAGLNKVAGSKLAGQVVPALTRSGSIAGANLAAGADNPSAIPGAPAGGTPPAGMPGTNPLNQAFQQEVDNQNDLMTLAAEVPGNFGGTGYASAASGLGGVIGSLAPQIQKQEQVAPVLAALEPSFANAGGAQGTAGGLMTEATSLIPGSAANTYAREQSTAAATLASLLGITPQQAMGLLPRVTQTPGSAEPSQAATNSILQSLGVPGLSPAQ